MMFIELLKRYWFTFLLLLACLWLWAENTSLENKLQEIHSNESKAIQTGVENSYDIFLRSQQKQDEIGQKYAFNIQKYDFDVANDITGISDGTVRVQFTTQHTSNETKGKDTVSKDGFQCPTLPVAIPIPVQQDIRRLQNSIDKDAEVIAYLTERVKLLEGIIDEHNLK